MNKIYYRAKKHLTGELLDAHVISAFTIYLLQTHIFMFASKEFKKKKLKANV